MVPVHHRGLEVLCAILLLGPKTAAIGATLLAVTMVGAIATHLFIIGGRPVPAIVLLPADDEAWRGIGGLYQYAENSEVCTCSTLPS